MYVLCTLAVLTLHSLFKSRHKASEAATSEAGERTDPPADGAPAEGPGVAAARGRRGGGGPGPGDSGPTDRGPEGEPGRGDGLRNVPDSRKRVQPVQRSSALLSPAVMFGTRKTWDLGHAPCLQDLWKTDISLDASSVDFLMSDGEEDGSFLSLPPAAFPQRPSLSAELSDTNPPPSQQLLIQTLQEKVCEFQARLRSEEVTRHLLLQRLQQSPEQRVQEKSSVIQEEEEEEEEEPPPAPPS
ncbi:uncharacterized protein, partial [Centroberyx affinis]|uniref:uncharacterized protein n=1 Tax=Centroberyx affinis TaxID=166261 RepID=UPI003A5C5A59